MTFEQKEQLIRERLGPYQVCRGIGTRFSLEADGLIELILAERRHKGLPVEFAAPPKPAQESPLPATSGCLE